MPEPTKATDPTTSTDDGKTPKGSDAAGAGTQTANTEDADKKFTQADLDRIAAKTRAEEREKATKAAEEAERKRKEEEAKKQGEFEGLYNTLKPQFDTQAEQLTRYQETVKTLAEGELAALPDEVKDMAPSLDDPLAVLAWLPKGKKLAERLEGQPAKPGPKEDPKPKKPTGDAEKDKAAATAARRGTYSSL